MKKHAKQSIELDHLNLTPEAKTEVSNLIQSLLAQAQNERKLLEAKKKALMLELAQKTGKPMFRRLKRKSSSCRFRSSPSVHAPGANRYRIICHASNTDMNRNPANANSVAVIW